MREEDRAVLAKEIGSLIARGNVSTSMIVIAGMDILKVHLLDRVKEEEHTIRIHLARMYGTRLRNFNDNNWPLILRTKHFRLLAAICLTRAMPVSRHGRIRISLRTNALPKDDLYTLNYQNRNQAALRSG